VLWNSINLSRAQKFKIIFTNFIKKKTNKNFTYIYYNSLLFNFTLPAKFGELYLIKTIKENYHLIYKSSFIYIYFKFFDLFLFLLMFFLSFANLSKFFLKEINFCYLLFLFVIILTILFLLIYKYKNKFKSNIKFLLSIFFEIKTHIRTFSITLFYFSLKYMLFFIYGLIIGINFNFIELTTILFIMMTGLLFPAYFGFLGIFSIGISGFFIISGYTFKQSLLLVAVSQIIPTIFFGIYLVYFLKNLYIDENK